MAQNTELLDPWVGDMGTASGNVFAGAAGWAAGANEHDGLRGRVVGVEIMPEAVKTARAAGHRVVSVSAASAIPPLRGLVGLIGSPPCQAWSMSGKGLGRMHDVELCEQAARLLGAGEDRREALAEKCRDPRSILVVEPLRWALKLRPEWIALEQVPPVLGFWELCATILRDHGYSVWCGILSAEQFGVPQTRKRAILIASRVREVAAPRPTHRRFIPPTRRDESVPSLFDLPPERRVHVEDEHLLPWVSMAQALGWDREELVGFARRPDDDRPSDAGKDYRTRDRRAAKLPAQAVTEKARSWDRQPPPYEAPAPTLTGGGTEKGGGVAVFGGAKARDHVAAMRTNDRKNAAVRHVEEPSATITAGRDSGERVWLRARNNTTVTEDGEPVRFHRESTEPAPTVLGAGAGEFTGQAPTHYDRRQGKTENDGTRRMSPLIPVDEPAPTIASQGVASGRDRWVDERPAPTVVTTRRSKDGVLVGRQLPDGEGENVGGKNWTDGRPATTVAGDSRVHPGGHKTNAEDEAAGRTSYEGRAGKNAVRVSVAQAAVLQGFREDYPFQGSRTAQYMQVGNAIPPPLASAVLAVAAGATS